MSRDIDDFLRHEIQVGSFPGACYAFGSADGIAGSGALGLAVAVPLRVAASRQTVYDCASITKPLITTMLILQHVAEGTISLDDEFHGHSYRRLLTHTSGLKAWLPLYTWPDYLQAILEHGRETTPGTAVIYSDLNFILLYFALEAIGGDFREQARHRIFEPLAIEEAWFNPAATLRPRIAATEWGQRFETRLAERSVIDGVRQGLMWGQTNDGNSFHHGGTAGNAGLFATVDAVYRLAQAWLRQELLPGALVTAATSLQTKHLNQRRGFGWQLADESSRAPLTSAAFGHTGFTGTSVWVDPDRDRVFVLLTNRVHPCAAPVGMQTIRNRFHELAVSAMKH